MTCSETYIGQDDDNIVLFLGFLHSSTMGIGIAEKSEYTLRVFQLQARHCVLFRPFVARVPRLLIEAFASAALWPKDVFRQCRGSMPQMNATSGKKIQRRRAVLSLN